jgi:hypothetical protein
VSAGGTLADAGQAVAADLSGNVHVAGQLQQSHDVTGAPDPSGAFVAQYSTTGSLMWMQHIGGDLSDDATGIAVDRQLNTYVTGTFLGPATFDAGHTLTPAPGDGVHGFIEKLDAHGHVVWVKDIGSPRAAAGIALALDGKANVYTTGTFSSSATVAGHAIANPTGTPQTCSFLTKLDSSGNCQWVQVFGVADGVNGLPADASAAHAITVNSGGSAIYVAGAFGGANVRLGTSSATPLTLSAKGGTDIFVEKFGFQGAAVWAVRAGSTTPQPGLDGSANGIALDPAGNVCVVGSFDGTYAFGAQTLTANAGGSDGFVSRLNPTSGAFLKTVGMGGAGPDAGMAVAVDAAGKIDVTGSFSQKANVGVFQLSAAGDADVFVAQLDASLHVLCAVREGGPGRDQGLGIAVDSQGFIDLTGLFSQTGQFANPPVTLTSAGHTDVFVSRMPFVCPPTYAGLIDGHILGIQTDDGRHLVDIQDYGGTVRVAFDGQPAFTFDGVDMVKFETGDGSVTSTLNYNGTGGKPADLSIDQGDGPESLFIDYHAYQPTTAPAPWMVDLHGGNGRSRATFALADAMGDVGIEIELGAGVNSDNVTIAPSPSQAAQDHSATLLYQGGAGSDMLNVRIGTPKPGNEQGHLNAALNLLARGGSGMASLNLAYANVEIDAPQAIAGPDMGLVAVKFDDVVVAAPVTYGIDWWRPGELYTPPSATLGFQEVAMTGVPLTGSLSIIDRMKAMAYDVHMVFAFHAVHTNQAMMGPDLSGSGALPVPTGTPFLAQLALMPVMVRS